MNTNCLQMLMGGGGGVKYSLYKEVMASDRKKGGRKW